MFIVSLKYPELFPVLNWAKREATRQAIDLANSKKAMASNVPLLERILALRRGTHERINESANQRTNHNQARLTYSRTRI